MGPRVACSMRCYLSRPILELPAWMALVSSAAILVSANYAQPAVYKYKYCSRMRSFNLQRPGHARGETVPTQSNSVCLSLGNHQSCHIEPTYLKH